MAAITVSKKEAAGVNDWKTVVYYGIGTANQADTLTSTPVEKHKVQRLCSVTCVYSGAATQAGVTTSINDGIAAGYDALLSTGTANVLVTVYLPDGEVWLIPGDAVVVAAPAAGAGVTAAIKIVMQEKAG